MWFLIALSYVAVVFQFCFVSLSIASGLYYLAEVIEEFTATAAKVIRTMILVVLGIYVGFLIFEDFPLMMTLVGLGSQITHLYMMRTFPYFTTSSPAFILTIVFLALNHYLAFNYFSTHFYPFMEVMAYFTVCLWLIPFAFFVSLSANDLILPTQAENSSFMGEDNDAFSNYLRRKGRKLGLLTVLNSAISMVIPQRSKKAF